MSKYHHCIHCASEVHHTSEECPSQLQPRMVRALERIVVLLEKANKPARRPRVKPTEAVVGRRDKAVTP